MGDNIRKSNFELLRIIAMGMIVTLHTLGHGGALNNISIDSSKFLVINLIEAFCIVGVNLYILITGYFGVNSKFALKKLMLLYFQVIFYSVSISSIFILLGIEKFTIKTIIKTIFPIGTESWWYITVFFVLYLIAPYLNILIKHLDKSKFTKLILILGGVFVIWPTLSYIGFKPIDNQGGYSLYQFIFLYLIGAYIRINIEKVKINKYICLGIYTISMSILAIFNVTISRILGRVALILGYNFLLVMIGSITIFLFFKEVEIENSLVNKISRLTLGIYLIHDHAFVNKWVYKTMKYEMSFSFNLGMFLLYTIGVVVTIFVTCLIIEKLRQILFYKIECLICTNSH